MTSQSSLISTNSAGLEKESISFVFESSVPVVQVTVKVVLDFTAVKTPPLTNVK
jgi:hypothetical protein